MATESNVNIETLQQYLYMPFDVLVMAPFNIMNTIELFRKTIFGKDCYIVFSKFQITKKEWFCGNKKSGWFCSKTVYHKWTLLAILLSVMHYQ